MRMTKIVATYLMRQFLASFLLVFAIVGSLIVIFDLIDLLKKIANKTILTHGIIFKMLCLRLPMHIQEVIPFIILFTAILAFWRLNRSSEVTILRTSGLSIWQILAPIVLITLIIGLIDLIFLSPFAAKMMGRSEFYEAKYINTKEQSYNLTHSGIWLRESQPSESRIYHIDHIDHQDSRFHNLSIYTFSNQNKFIKRYKANFGYLDKNQIVLKDVIEIQYDQPAVSLPSLTLRTQLSLIKIQESMADPRTLPFWDLVHYAKLMEESGLSGQRYLSRFHNLLARSLWLVVMVLLASTFSLNHVRSIHTFKIIIFGILSAFLLYFLRELMVTLSDIGKIPNILGAWIPTCATGLIAVTRLLYSEDG